MTNDDNPDAQGARLTAEYSKARSLLEEKRKAMARVVEIDRMLRKLSSEDPRAVEVASAEIQFRRPRGRPRSEK